MNRKTLLPAVAGMVATVLAACGGGPGTGGGEKTIVVGTTEVFALSKDTPAPFDPAAAYDANSWTVLRNTFQTLLRVPRSGTELVGEVARQCGFTDRANEQYRCTLHQDLKFSNGHDLTAEDVAYSIRRSMNLAVPNGPVSLLSNIDTVEATSPSEVVFHLKEPDATFPYKLATPAAAIVDSEEYPADKLKRGFDLVGSGPYTLDSVDLDKKRAVFRPNSHYRGGVEVKNDGIELRFFDSPEAMEKALRAGDIDVMSRSFGPEQIERLDRDDDRIEVVEAPGQEIRCLFFDVDADPVQKVAVRRAVAQVINRKELVRDVYARTAEPLYTPVPTGLIGHRNSFFNRYGEPDVDAARTTLRNAGVDTPVRFELAYTPDHGPVTKDEFETVRQQLNDSGLFDVTLRRVPRADYYPQVTRGEHAVFGMGWIPDFPDAENFVAPFVGPDSYLRSAYRDKELFGLIDDTRRTAQRSSTLDGFGRMQDIIARDVPLVPLWQGKQYIAVRDDITGAEWALNSTMNLQMWELGRGIRG